MRSIYVTLVAVVGLLLTGTSFAATINVPGDYPTIQQAVDAANHGDEIIVAPGVYAENNVNTNSKSITIQGSLSEDGTLLTTVDGGAGGRVFQVISGEGLDTVIRDLVITGGFTSGDGGGIVIDDSSPRIINCTIIDNEANYGGGGDIGEGDGIVNVNDVLVLIGLWGTAGPIGDLNFDDVVNVNDLLLMLDAWDQECDA